MDGGNAPLTSNEIQERIEAPASSQTVKIGSYTIQYAFISQRGFYPDDRDKANQDAYAVEMQFGGHKDRALFMVFDGHGKEGELCAQFCRDHLPPTMAKSMTSKDAKNPVSIESAMMQAFMRTNEALHAADNVDDSLSGTTAVGILFDGRDMYVANVGDSRAIVCQEHEGRLQAKPLSCDQTPYRKDERERVKACGARVMSMDQIEGLEPIHENWGDVKLGEELDEGGDPPRIWSPFGEYPGTAFTRSMGDVIAEELGVFAEPEVIRRRLQPSDRFVVVASDGVFEFLTNQSVADMIARYKDPLEACKKVVQEAYDLWLQYEVRTDDITIIAMYLDGLSVDGSSAPLPAASNDLDDIALHGLRPVRREMSRTRQRELILDHGSTDLSAWNGSLTSSGSTTPRSFIDSDAGYKVEDHVVKKSKEEREAIELAMGANFLFDHVTEQQKGILLDVMRRVEVRAGEYVIREGEEGDRFYIINQGQFEVRVKSSAGPSASADEPEHEAGTLVHVYNPTDTIKPCFGHLSLLYSKPRSASVIAITDGILWALDRPVFRRILVKKSRREIARVLRQVDVLRSLNLHQLSQLCDVFTEVEFAAGESIISQGEVGDTFYILEAGSAMVTMDDGDGKPVRELRRLRPYSYFGERALLLSEPRSANVVAVSPVRCLVLSQNAFEQVLGPLQGIIDEDRKAREGRRTVPSLSELRVLGQVATDTIGQMNICKLPGSNATCTLRTMWKSSLESSKQASTALRAVELSRHASESPALRVAGCPTVPLLLATYSTPQSVHTMHQAAIVCTVGALLQDGGPLPPDAARHTIACALLGLDVLHRANVLYRALSPELLCIDNRGYTVLMDFRLAKLGIDAGATLCGAPDYLAPEQVRQLPHNRAVDFWALGILLYELVHGSSPFDAESEMDTCARIAAHSPGGLDYPTSFEPSLCDLLDRLLHPDPALRLGVKKSDIAAIKSHQWFAGFDWGGLARGEYFNGDLRQIAHGRIQKALRAQGEISKPPQPYAGDQEAWRHWERL